MPVRVVAVAVVVKLTAQQRRQIDRQVPRDLERICLQCLQKRSTDRYSTTDDLREDLQAWLTQAASTEIPQSSK